MLDTDLHDYALTSSLDAIGTAYAAALREGLPDPVIVIRVDPHRLSVRAETRHLAATRLNRLAPGAGRSIMAWPDDRPCSVLVESPEGLRVAHLALDDDGVPCL